MKGKDVYLGVGIALLLCGGLPAAGFATFNLLYFVREQLWPVPTLAADTATPAVTATATATPAPACGGPPAMFVLLIGSDSRADNYLAGLADAMRIVRVDFVHPGLSYLTFQRDLYVEIPGIASHGGITHGKLNQAYFYGNPALGYFDGPGQGPGLLAATLQHNFGTRVDHFVAINLQSFTRIVNELGGVDINLPYTVDGRATRSLDKDKYFPAGPQHLDGYRTMLLARIRPMGDLQRSHTQNLILQAFAAQLLTPESLPRLPAIVESRYGSVQTDLGPQDVSALLCLGAILDPSQIEARSFPDELLTAKRIQDPVLGNTFIWEADFGRLREYVGSFNEGAWPPAGAATPTAPTP